ncbi:uncharacterized protein LOC108882524 [Lates calcarifer]|uniref:lysozyme n=1 Tax=Lates calcarifer TaxID=8187 RepID=A0AAJ7LRT0_LATCA|nr:uncharacterized protein LOC108882524 [Lates calcarifer]
MFSESETIVGVKMKLLAVFLLAVLGCGLAEGLLVSKCDLRDQLRKAIASRIDKEKQQLSEETLAKIVCHAETASGFNTSVIHELSPEMDNHQHRRRRNAGYEGIFGLAEYEGTESTISPHTQGRRSAKEHLSPTWPKPPTRPQSRYRTTPATQPTHDDKEVWTLYGLFQLSNHLVCSDGTTPSPNICDKNCSDFVDDDINDDIKCVLDCLNKFLKDGFNMQHAKEMKRMIMFIFQEECRGVTASDYFAECA